MADHPEFLKHPDAPSWDYHVWTPLLEARGDLLPFTPLKAVQPDDEVRSLLGEQAAALRLVDYENGWYGIVDRDDKPVGPRVRGLDKAKMQLEVFLSKLYSKGKSDAGT